MKRTLFAAGLALMALWSVAPFLWSMNTSFKSPEELRAVPPTLVPRDPTAANYREVFTSQPFSRFMLNSLIVGTGSTALALAVGALAAYAIARLRVPGGRAMQRALLAFALCPPAVLVVPLLAGARAVGLTNSHLAVILVHAALNVPFAVWMLAAFFREFPAELEDAARVDGFSRFGILTRLVVPLSAPALGATAILLFIFSWNEFVLALTLLSHDSVTVPVGISRLTGASAYEVPWGQISAAVVLTTLPVVAAVFAFQRWIVGGVTAGAVKG